jgi:Na+/melibiose symporter-like transporter
MMTFIPLLEVLFPAIAAIFYELDDKKNVKQIELDLEARKAPSK